MPPERVNAGTEGPELAERVRELRDRARSRMDVAELMDAIAGFAKRLQERYPDCRNRRAFHALIGSTPYGDQRLIEGDFPGGDSVIVFLESVGKAPAR